MVVGFWTMQLQQARKEREDLDHKHVTSGFLIKNALLTISTLISLYKSNYVFDCFWVSFISVLAGSLDIFLSSFQLISFLFLSFQRTQLLNMEDFLFSCKCRELSWSKLPNPMLSSVFSISENSHNQLAIWLVYRVPRNKDFISLCVSFENLATIQLWNKYFRTSVLVVTTDFKRIKKNPGVGFRIDHFNI